MVAFFLRGCCGYLPSSASLEADSHGHRTLHVAGVTKQLADFPRDEPSEASGAMGGYLRGFISDI